MRVGEFVPPDSKTYWKKTTTIIWYWQKNREIHQQNTVENPEDLFVYKKIMIKAILQRSGVIIGQLAM